MPEADFAEGSKVGSNSVTMTPGVVYVNDLPRFEGVTEAGRSFLAPAQLSILHKAALDACDEKEPQDSHA